MCGRVFDRCVKDSPRLQMGDGSLHSSPQRVDDPAAFFLGFRELCSCRFPVGCEKSKPDISLVGQGRGVLEVFEEAGGLDGLGVVSGSWGRPGDLQEPAGQIGDDLEVHPGPPVFP
mgnify:CR=1 FL=1